MYLLWVTVKFQIHFLSPHLCFFSIIAWILENNHPNRRCICSKNSFCCNNLFSIWIFGALKRERQRDWNKIVANSPSFFLPNCTKPKFGEMQFCWIARKRNAKPWFVYFIQDKWENLWYNAQRKDGRVHHKLDGEALQVRKSMLTGREVNQNGQAD